MLISLVWIAIAKYFTQAYTEADTSMNLSL